jgi:GTP-binding protein HflX
VILEKTAQTQQAAGPERTGLVGIDFTRTPVRTVHADGPAFTAAESLEELRELAIGAGADVVYSTLQQRNSPEAATLIGAGKVEELATIQAAESISLFIFDAELSPTQQRNLENRLNARVIGRTQLILDIFARRAQTREGKLQVELAQLSYLLPRLTGKGLSLSRLGGGIGTRGPGETQLETDRRRIARRIRKLEEDLENVRRGRGVQRASRASVPLSTAALVGYTNAGKSTLFNRLSGADVLADDRLFATLDPTVRAIQLPTRRKLLLSDTVGFIRNLPTSLVKAFRATLEEASLASVLLHVVDASSEHSPVHVAHVNDVIREIGADTLPTILVLNKCDRLEDGGQSLAAHFAATQPDVPVVAVSALTGLGFERLLAELDRHLLTDPTRRVRFRFPHSAVGHVGKVHDRSKVLRREYTEDGYLLEAEAPESLIRTLQSYVEEVDVPDEETGEFEAPNAHPAR